ncbi:MAG: glycosyltransferase [Acidimicrobiales bacterium]
MRVAAIHQFLPSLAPRDAIGTHTLSVQATLRGMGLRSQIYADLVHPELAGLALPFNTFAGHARGHAHGGVELLLYHASIGSRVADYVLERPEPKLVNFHNITPVSSLVRWEPSRCAELEEGRRQLAQLAPVTLHAVADSSYNQAELVAAGYGSTSVAPIQLDPEGEVVNPDAATMLRLTRARANGGAALLFVGRLVPNKAQHDLVRALAVYRRLYDPRARLHLVGTAASWNYYRALRALIQRLGLGDAVDLAGSVGPADLAAYYHGADVFVCLSDHEGFCLPLLEAMGYALPIVAFGAAAVPETLGSAGVLIPAKDPLTVSVALHRVLSDAGLRRDLELGRTQRLAELSVARGRAVFQASIRRALALAEVA